MTGKLQVSSVHKKGYLSRNTQVLPCKPCQHWVLLLLGFPPVPRVLVSAQGLISVPVAVKQLQLRNSFANVKNSKPGELIHLALSITIIVRFVYVKQSSFQLWSINFVSGNILLHFSASPYQLSACTSTPPCCSCCSLWGVSTEGQVQSPGEESRRPHCRWPSLQSPQELPPEILRCVWCQNDLDLDFSSSSEYKDTRLTSDYSTGEYQH